MKLLDEHSYVFFCPLRRMCYFGGQMGDKIEDNLQISKLKIKNLQK